MQRLRRLADAVRFWRFLLLVLVGVVVGLWDVMPTRHSEFPALMREYYAYLRSLEPVVEAQAATHYVSATGNASSNCTIGTPCTWTRAVALINNGTINDGAVVQLAAGRYAQAFATITGSGRSGSPITIRGAPGADVYMTGARYEVPHGNWRRTAGRTYTYELIWDEAVRGWSPGNIGQDRPTNWTNIPIDDSSNNHVFYELTEPPIYRVKTTIAAVEAQGGSFYFDATANRVYVHTYHDGAPVDGDNIWLLSTSWGSIEIDGDYITIENIDFEQVHSTSFGFQVDDPSDHFIGRDIRFIGTLIDVEGTNWLMEDIETASTGEQGNPVPSCDTSAIFVGQCFADSGGRTAFNASGGGPGILRRANITKGWNGFSTSGGNGILIEDTTIWGFPNHGFGMGGTGNRITRSIVFNSQESFYSQQSNLPLINLVMDNNFLIDAVLFRHDGNSNVRFTNNIVKVVRMDAANFAGLVTVMDCNLYFKESSEEIFDLDGGPKYDTIAEVQANTPYEDHGFALNESDFNTGKQFVLFAKPYTDTWDLHPVAGARSLLMGPSCNSYVGPLALEGVTEIWRLKIL